MSDKSETTQLGMNPDDGSPLMNGTELPGGSLYNMARDGGQRPVMRIDDQPFGDPVSE